MRCIALIAAPVVAPATVGTLALSASGQPIAAVSTEPAVSDADGADQPGEPLDLGRRPVLLTAPTVAAAGERPAFAWEPVDGAALYTLAIVADSGEPLWAWQGPETAVILGGWIEVPPPEAPGPLLLGPSNWFVVARDGEGRAIANSVLRPVAP